jgi:hypothetical protein
VDLSPFDFAVLKQAVLGHPPGVSLAAPKRDEDREVSSSADHARLLSQMMAHCVEPEEGRNGSTVDCTI